MKINRRNPEKYKGSLAFWRLSTTFFAYIPGIVLINPKNWPELMVSAYYRFMAKGKTTAQTTGKGKTPNLQQWRFIIEYCKDCNQTQAAIRAGYSEKTASQAGYDTIKKPYVFKEIQKRLKALSMSADEATKIHSDIAGTRLQDYMITTLVDVQVMVEVSILEYIEQMQRDYDFEKRFAAVAGFSETEMNEHEARQKQLQRHIARTKLEAEDNPNQTRKIKGPIIQQEQVGLDLVKLAKSRDRGHIKKFYNTKDGIRVELYDTAKAAERVLNIHGKINKRKPGDEDTGDEKKRVINNFYYLPNGEKLKF